MLVCCLSRAGQSGLQKGFAALWMLTVVGAPANRPVVENARKGQRGPWPI